MGPLRPSRHTYDFRDADAVVDFGRANDMRVRAHTLVWRKPDARVVPGVGLHGRPVEAFLRDHVHTVAGRYRDKVDTWDVVNEAVADDGSMRETVWYDAMGEEYLDNAFQWASGRSPTPTCSTTTTAPTGSTRSLTRSTTSWSGCWTGAFPSTASASRCTPSTRSPTQSPWPRTSAGSRTWGLDVEITEMDVAYLPEDDPGDEAARQERQAEFYRDIVDVCLETGCDTVVVWGVRDSDSWVPTWFGSSRTTRSCSTTATTRNHPTTRSKKRSRTTDSGGCKPVPASTRTK